MVRPLIPTGWHVAGDVNWRDIRAGPSDYCLRPALSAAPPWIDTEVGPRRTELQLSMAGRTEGAHSGDPPTRSPHSPARRLLLPVPDQTVWGEGWAARLARTQPAGLSMRSY